MEKEGRELGHDPRGKPVSYFGKRGQRPTVIATGIALSQRKKKDHNRRYVGIR